MSTHCVRALSGVEQLAAFKSWFASSTCSGASFVLSFAAACSAQGYSWHQPVRMSTGTDSDHIIGPEFVTQMRKRKASLSLALAHALVQNVVFLCAWPMVGAFISIRGCGWVETWGSDDVVGVRARACIHACILWQGMPLVNALIGIAIESSLHGFQQLHAIHFAECECRTGAQGNSSKKRTPVPHIHVGKLMF